MNPIKEMLSLSNYRIVTQIYRSDTSRVYRAESLVDNKKVVIKQFEYDLFLFTESQRQHFLAHIQKIHLLKHEGLIKTFDFLMVQNKLYQIMESLSDETLKQRLYASVDFPLESAIDWFRQITQALLAVHQAGLIHRDLKTTNILFRDKQLVLLDYGLEKQWLLHSGLLQENEIYGTPYSISPERIKGGNCTQSSDLYSLGVIFYELLVKKKPYDAPTLPALMSLHMFAKIPRLPKRLAHYQILLNALLAKSPQNRIDRAETVLLFLDDL